MGHEETLARAAEPAAASFDFSGEWTNQHGSTMEIVQEQGVLTGVFASRIGQGRAAGVGQVSGYAQGDLISVTAKWDAMAIASWVGRRRVETGEDVVETLWQMTMAGEDDAGGSWHAIQAGADRFTRPTARVGGTPPGSHRTGEAAVAPAEGRGVSEPA